ncbi:Imm53 family immunity protein, partial [Acinetobacter baumannii]|uniref:Imm53 family immunity protein n=1 Tax=Acinetobacter baumannii TaxID=470 RepID=UPI0037D8ECF0
GNWFLQECDGDWEHENQIKIETVSNPGWHVVIDLNGTSLEKASFESQDNKAEDDWYFISIKNRQFVATCDMKRLDFVLLKFLELVKA